MIGHSDKVACISYSPQGDLLASGGWDKTVRLWNTSTGYCQAVIRNFQDIIPGIAWNTASGAHYLIAGCMDGPILKWHVLQEGEMCRLQPQWCITNGTLTVTGTSMQGARELTDSNKQLLRQRGVIDEPEYLIQEASKTLRC
jgi:WD40 repeat protein